MLRPALACLPPVPPDPLLWLIEAFRSDPRPEKLDLGVGVWRDAHGHTPVLASVKEAERRLLQSQQSKDYVGAAGALGFVARLSELVFADSPAPAFGLQVPGGTAALRLAIDLLA